MKEKQLTWVIITILGILAFIFVPYKVGTWVMIEKSNAVMTWINGLFTVVIGVVGVALGIVGYQFFKK